MLITNTLTNKEHVRGMGGECPVCESSDFESASGMDAAAGTLWQSMFCHICGANWTDYYALKEYGLESPDYYQKDTFKVIKTFDSGTVSIVEVEEKKAVVVETKTPNKRSWFTKLNSPRIKRIKNKRIREEVEQALTEIGMVEALEPKQPKTK